MVKSYWLLKTEPESWSWKNQQNSKKKGVEWDGVRNYQALKNLKSMKKEDLCFFYHTGKEKRIMGIVKVIKEYFSTTLTILSESVDTCIASKRLLFFNSLRG